jgi:hypothetical protein
MSKIAQPTARSLALPHRRTTLAYAPMAVSVSVFVLVCDTGHVIADPSHRVLVFEFPD